MGILDRFRSTRDDAGAEQRPEPLDLPIGVKLVELGGEVAAVTAEDLSASALVMAQAPVIHNGRLIHASQSAAALFPIDLKDLVGDDWAKVRNKAARFEEAVANRDLDGERALIVRLTAEATSLVHRYLESNGDDGAFIEELRILASKAAPAIIQYVGPEENARWAWVDEETAVFAVARDSQIPVHWYPSSARAWSTAGAQGVLLKTIPSRRAVLLQLSFGDGILLDPKLIDAERAENDGLLDPVTREDWTPTEHEVARGQLAIPRQLKIEGRGGITFILIGGPAIVVAHDGTHRLDGTGTTDSISSWVLEDRMIE